MVKSIFDITTACPHHVHKHKLMWVTIPLLHSPPQTSFSLAMPSIPFRVGSVLSSGSCVLDSTICPVGDDCPGHMQGHSTWKLVCCPLLVLQKHLKDSEAGHHIDGSTKEIGERLGNHCKHRISENLSFYEMCTAS